MARPKRKTTKPEEGQDLLKAVKRSYPKQGTFTDKLFRLYERKVHRLVPEEVEDLLNDIDHVWEKGEMPLMLEIRLLRPLLEMFFHPSFYYSEEVTWKDYETDQGGDIELDEKWSALLEDW